MTDQSKTILVVDEGSTFVIWYSSCDGQQDLKRSCQYMPEVILLDRRGLYPHAGRKRYWFDYQ